MQAETGRRPGRRWMTSSGLMRQVKFKEAFKMMTSEEKHQYLMTCELERFGSEGAEKKHHSRDYNAYKSGWQQFLESDSHYSACPLPERAQNTVRQGKVRINKEYPAWYIEQENSRLAKLVKAETEDAPF